jgi:hypothetical protein
MARFCFDSNVLIEAKNGPYAFDIAPGFWSWLDSLIAQGELYVCRRFKVEYTNTFAMLRKTGMSLR